MRGKFNEKYPLADPAAQGLKTYICGLNFSVLRGWLLIFTLLMATSCLEEGNCLVTNSTLVRVKLKSLKTKADTTIAFTTISLENDVALYSNRSLGSFELPVNPAATVTSFYFERPGQEETLTLQYRNEAVVISPDCGAFEFQKDVKAIYNTLGRDSVRWINNQLAKSVTVNVEVYF